MTRSLVRTLVIALAVCASSRAQNGAYSDQTVASGIDASYGPGNHTFIAGGAVGDFDRDGFQDVFYPAGKNGPDLLYLNNGDGTFREVGAAWGVDRVHRSSAAAVADYDGDGWLDIYVTSFGKKVQGEPGKHLLYRNTGNGTFDEVAAAAGVNQSSASQADGWGAAWGDYDLDGDLDLAVCGWLTNDGNRLFRNEGDGTFADVTVSAGLSVLSTVVGFAPRFVDMDGDRYPELIWIGDFSTSRYFVNQRDGTFSDFTQGSGTSQDGTEMGATVGDMDGDGDFDFYVTTIVSNNLYVNKGGNTFVNKGKPAGVEDTGMGWGTVAIDFDHDMWVDLVATSAGGQQYASVT